jgi:hypothetical protein
LRRTSSARSRNEFGLSTSNVHVIENWAPLADISVRPKSNAWAVEQQLAEREVVLYSGTLGLKHDPALLLQLAEALRSRPQALIVVTSEGPSADAVQKDAAAMKLQNIRVLPFQPFETYADVLGSADVLIGILQADAGRFSVPSKILSYLCAARPIVLSAPAENLASRTVTAAGAGDRERRRRKRLFFRHRGFSHGCGQARPRRPQRPRLRGAYLRDPCHCRSVRRHPPRCSRTRGSQPPGLTTISGALTKSCAFALNKG